MTKKVTVFLYSTILVLCLSLFLSSTTNAQTIYKNDAGYFASIKSLYFRGGNIESAQLIGPAFGYRFNEKYDVSLHTEFLSSEIKFSGRDNGTTSLLNLGITLGRTKRIIDKLALRSELSFYQSLNFEVEGFPEVEDPSLTSIQYANSIYTKLSLTNTFKLMPNIGGFVGYGQYRAPVTEADLTQAFDGFVAGPDVGLDFLFRFSNAFSMATTPSFRYHLTDNAPHDAVLNLNFQFNF